jgi:hypothetical protein
MLFEGLGGSDAREALGALRLEEFSLRGNLENNDISVPP